MDRRSVLGGALAAGATLITPYARADDRRGRYSGRLVVELQDDGRLVKLLRPFSYVDPDGLKWPVKAGAKLDGASIPKPFWSVVGGPFEGKYRKASVIHDWYCDVRVRPWKQVHRMFYEAMIDAGVAKPKAKAMFLAVWAGGPRWNQQQIDNARLARRTGLTQEVCIVSADGERTCVEEAPREPDNDPPLLTDPERLRALAAQVEAQDPPLEAIEAMFPAQTIEPFPTQLQVGVPPPEPNPNPPV